MKLQVTLPAGLQSAMTRFDAMSLRERALIGMAMLSCLLVLWDSALMQPLNKKRDALLAIVEGDPANSLLGAPTAALNSIDGAATVDPDPIGTALLQRESLRTNLIDINQQLLQVSAGLIAPERMSEVLYDVLRQQQGVTLISLHNKPVTSLAPVQAHTDADSSINAASNGNAVAAAADTKRASAGPYQHSVELVIEGRYLDILQYLRALEALPWRFNWQSLQLDSSRYPLNRATIKLSTVSLDPAWIGT